MSEPKMVTMEALRGHTVYDTFREPGTTYEVPEVDPLCPGLIETLEATGFARRVPEPAPERPKPRGRAVTPLTTDDLPAAKKSTAS